MSDISLVDQLFLAPFVGASRQDLPSEEHEVHWECEQEVLHVVSSGISINSNIPSLIAQRRVSDNTTRLSKVFASLSSGLRINKAGDDAAGLAISEALGTDSRVFTQAVRNINDGLSALAIAEGAFSELSNTIFRLRELATQSANGTLSHSQRKALDEEAQQLSKEFTRIQQTTKFNTLGLLNGENESLRVQAGYGLPGSILADVGKFLGDGTFGGLFTQSGTTASDIITADFNSDGFTDIIASKGLNEEITFYAGQGDGSFIDGITMSVSGSGSVMGMGDLNGDGILDLVMDGDGNELTILIGSGDGTFKNENRIGLGISPSDLVLSDFNGDGILDIAVATTASANRFDILLGNGDGTFQQPEAYLTGVGIPSYRLTAGDVNGDRIVDIITTNAGMPHFSVVLGNGDGTFSPGTSYPGPATSSPSDVKLHDLNNDGHLDLVFSNPSLGNVEVALGNGNGTFASLQGYSTGASTQDAAIGDFNGDGIPDIVAANAGNDTVSVLLGRGDGTFNSAVNYQAGDVAAKLTLADFNGDGVLDVAVANNSGNSFSILAGVARSGVAPLLPFDLTTKAGALQALGSLDRKLNTLSIQRGVIGAIQSRLEVANNLLQVSTEGFKTAQSRIVDTDTAEDSGALLKFSILQQASAAVLAQANVQPDIALQLLR